MRIQPKKRLGQNFILDKNIQNKIIEACGFEAGDIVLEIGAGTGEMTSLIAARVKRVFALELDSSLMAILTGKLERYPNVRILQGDILKLDLRKNLKPFGKIKVFGNIPYYISSPILEHLFEYREIISEIFITVQKEFAQRLIASAGSGDYGRLSCFAEYYSAPQALLYIKRGSFFPSPKVDSCLVKLVIRSKPLLTRENERLLFGIIKSAFSQRRKKLKNTIGNIPLPEGLRDKRPEEVSLSGFLDILKIIQKKSKKRLTKTIL